MNASLGRLVVLVSVASLLVACGSNPTSPEASTTAPSRYRMEQDVGPSGSFDASQVPDVVPTWEPLSRRGNRSPYEVLGKSYQVMQRNQPYQEEGIASWYGLKFHQEQTSNGEIYDMYQLTAAHKTLPLPSYVRVTNLRNQRSVVVRVNDRGPFHPGRIIDLSYAAAKKLGYANVGTAKVKVELLSVDQNDGVVSTQPAMSDYLAQFLQIAAYSQIEAAQNAKRRVENYVDGAPVFVAKAPDSDPAVYRLRVGPFANTGVAELVLAKIKSAGIGSPMLITRAISAKDR